MAALDPLLLLSLAARLSPEAQLCSLKRKCAALARWRTGAPGCRPGLQRQLRKAQTAYVNREIVSLDDYRFDERPARNKSRGAGSGKWRQRTPEELVRCISSCPAQTIISVAKSLRPAASHKHVCDVFMASSSLLLAMERRAIADLMSRAVFVVFQIIHDETTFRLLVPPQHGMRGRPADQSLYAVHGRLLLGFVSGTVLEIEEDDLICGPATLYGKTASHMWQGLKVLLPASLWKLFEGELPFPSLQAASLCPVQDQFAANSMLLAHLDRNISDAPIFNFRGFCKQHATGNAMGPPVKYLGILTPSYCLGRRMRNYSFQERFLRGVKMGLSQELFHITGSKFPQWAPDPDNCARAEALLELCYYKKDLRTSIDPNSEHEKETPEQVRRRRGEALLERFKGNFMNKQIDFHDPRGEFATHEEAAGEGFRLLMDMNVHSFSDPAGNK